MAIQIPNPGTGNGASGDNEFVLWSKVKDNFSDQTHAASRLVGTANGNLVQMSGGSVGGFGLGGIAVEIPYVNGGRRFTGDNNYTAAFYRVAGALDAPKILGLRWGAIYLPSHTDQSGVLITASDDPRDKGLYLLQRNMDTYGEWIKCYTTGNTKLDTNGAIAPSSPTIDLYSDRIETNDDGARMNPVFVRNGVGDYTIKNSTGLRDEGWYIKIPNDMNGNPKVAVAIDTDKDGNLSIKTYRRTFSMETFTFIPDLETPLDIPEGRWIDLRFNDLPYDELDDTQTEV